MLSNVNSTSTPFLLHPVEGNANPEAPPSSSSSCLHRLKDVEMRVGKPTHSDMGKYSVSNAGFRAVPEQFQFRTAIFSKG